MCMMFEFINHPYKWSNNQLKVSIPQKLYNYVSLEVRKCYDIICKTWMTSA